MEPSITTPKCELPLLVNIGRRRRTNNAKINADSRRGFYRSQHNGKIPKMNKLDLFRELIERSQNERRGLTIFVHGQSITGTVANVVNEQAIVLTGRDYHQAVVLLESVDAMTVN